MCKKFKGRFAAASIGDSTIGVDPETGNTFQETSMRELIDGKWVETSRERRGEAAPTSKPAASTKRTKKRSAQVD